MYCKIKINILEWLSKQEKRTSQISTFLTFLNPAVILREKIAAELERLQAVDTTYLTAAKRGSIHKKIKQAQDKLTKVVEGAKKPDSMKRTTTSSGEGEKGKTQYSDDDTVRLIYARTYLDHEFNQHVNNRDGKWAMIQNIYNAGFIFPMSKLSPQPPEDVRFDPLSPDKHKTDDSLARKWEKLTSILRQIVVSKTEVHIQMKVHKKSLQGPKRDMAVLHAEVLKEANDAREKFKFYKVMESCGWVARIDPGERVNVAAFERAESLRQCRRQDHSLKARWRRSRHRCQLRRHLHHLLQQHRLLQHLRHLQHLQPALEATVHGKSTVASEEAGFVRPPRCLCMSSQK